MYEQDYILRLINMLLEAINRSIARAREQHDPRGAIEMLNEAISEAVDMDAGLLMSLTPESAVNILRLSSCDPMVMGYVVQCLMNQSEYLRELGDGAGAQYRADLAEALQGAFCGEAGECGEFGEEAGEAVRGE